MTLEHEGGAPEVYDLREDALPGAPKPVDLSNFQSLLRGAKGRPPSRMVPPSA